MSQFFTCFLHFSYDCELLPQSLCYLTTDVLFMYALMTTTKILDKLLSSFEKEV